MCYILFGAYPDHMRAKIIVKIQLVGKKETKKKEKTEKKYTSAQIRD
jgi:hypothetical protein